MDSPRCAPNFMLSGVCADKKVEWLSETVVMAMVFCRLQLQGYVVVIVE